MELNPIAPVSHPPSQGITCVAVWHSHTKSIFESIKKLGKFNEIKLSNYKNRERV
jgi:hypothetical protein